MVGRERPRRQLDEAFAEVRDERVCHLFTILGEAGVPNRVDSWGKDWHHDWPTWRNMLPKYLAEMV